MQKKYGKDGFVAVSVSLDEKDNLPRVKQFLEKVGADFPNYRLDVPPEVWQTKLKVDGPPCIYVFNRAGRFVKKLPAFDDKGEPIEEVDFKVIEKVVVDLLKKS